jgi:hypothetical protein
MKMSKIFTYDANSELHLTVSKIAKVQASDLDGVKKSICEEKGHWNHPIKILDLDSVNCQKIYHRNLQLFLTAVKITPPTQIWNFF